MIMPRATSHQLALSQPPDWIVYGRPLLNLLRRLGHVCLKIHLTKGTISCTWSASMRTLSS